MRRIVITGFEMITPVGLNARESFEHLVKGDSGVRRISNYDPSGFRCQVAGLVPEPNLETLAPEEWIRRMIHFAPRGAQLGILAMLGASRHARLGKADLRQCGLSIGTSGAFEEVRDLERFDVFLVDGGRWDQALFDANPDPEVLSERISMAMQKEIVSNLACRVCDVGGPTLTISSTCAAGTQATGEAYWAIQEGETDVMLAGGCDSLVDFVGLASFDLLSALSSRYNDTPQKASRPFDRKRKGFVLGEGAGAVVLEELDHALERNADIHAEVVGYASSCDAYRITDSAPDGIGARIAMTRALEASGLAPGEIDYINAHGTSTTLNDRTETLAIKKVFGASAPQIPISSIKSMIGHSIGGAGAIECVTCTMAILTGSIPPTINHENPDPDCDLDYVPNVARYQPVRTAMSNSFGFGGQNGSLVLKRYDS